MNNYVEKIRRGDSLTNFHDVELRETVDNIEDELSTDYATVEGNPINFSTKSAQNAKSTILSLEPIQDLHGYDKPWVGGAGKNLLQPISTSTTDKGITITPNSDGSVTLNGTKTDDNEGIVISSRFQVKANITYVVSIGQYDSSIITAIGLKGFGKATIITHNADYTSAGLQVYINKNTILNNVKIYPQIEQGSTTTSYEPYENLCPITGRTEIGILGCGKNIWDEEWENGYIYNGNYYDSNSYKRSKNFISVHAGLTYRIINITTDGQISCYDKNQTYKNNIPIAAGGQTYFIFTIPEGIEYIKFYNPNASFDNNVAILYPSTETTYEPYTQSTDLTISLGQTVYGGTLDVENGVLVVDRGYKTYNGSEVNTYTLLSSGRVNIDDATLGYYKQINKKYEISNLYEVVTQQTDNASFDWAASNKVSALDFSANPSSTTFTIRIKDPRFTDLNTAMSILANSPLEVCYKLATPIIINLTPHTINLLKGVNNISTDGDKITLTYRDGSVATLEDLLKLQNRYEEPYGFIEHMSILDPAQRIEYIGKNKNYNPMTVNLSGDHLANYNDWHDFFVLKENKPYMVKSDGTVDYALDPNDYTKKFDGSASDVADTTYTGGAFSWIPKIYKYEYVEGNDRYVYFSQKKLNDNYEAVGFIDENGLEHDGIWIPMFYGTEITQNDTVKIMSLATGTPSQSRDTATQKTYIENFSSQAKFFGGPIVNVLADLLIMLGKNSDVQAVFGTGNSSGGNGAQYMKANACLNGGAFYGSSTNTALNKAFHSLVLLTQNSWQRDPYTLCYKGEYIVSPYYKYDLTGASYVNTGVFVTPPSSNNWVYPNKSVSVPHWGAVPVGPYSGSTTTGWADGQYTLATQLTDTTVRVVLRFGSCNSGRAGGVRCVDLHSAASNTGWGLGASPLLLSERKTPV